MLKCCVNFLDGSEADIEVGKNAKSSTLLDEVCKRLDIVEKDYFGLIYKGSKLQKVWLILDKKIKKQINRRGKIEFDFVVKFYPTDPTKVREEITRYQICLQIRKDLAENLSCPVDKLTHLLSYWLQSEYQGRKHNSTVVQDCMKDFKNLPKEASSPDFIERVLTLCRERRDMPSANADNRFLATAAGLRLYGVHFYHGKEAAGNEVSIGIGAKGVVEMRFGQRPISHTWSRIKNIGYKNNRFKLKLLRSPANGDPRLKKSFTFDSEKQVHAIWKSAVEHHVFFHAGEKDKKPSDSTKRTKRKRSSIIRRLSSKKKKPKTEGDVLEESKGIKRQPPTVTRASSLRGSTSLRLGTSSESTTSLEHRAGASAPTQGSYSVSKEPQMDSETSSEAESEAQNVPEKVDEKPSVPDAVQLDAYPEQAQQQQDDADEEQGDGNESKDDDLIEAVIGRIDEIASGGSTTLLLTETILEEDEEYHQVAAMPSPRKRIYPVHFAPLRNEEHRQAPGLGSLRDTKESSLPLETDLDAEVLLSPVSPTGREETKFEDSLIQTEEDEGRYDIFPDRVEVKEEYKDDWEGFSVSPGHPQLDNVLKSEETEQRYSRAEDKVTDEPQTKESSSSSSSSSLSSSEEGEVRSSVGGGQEIPEALEDDVERVQEISIPNSIYPNQDGNREEEQFPTIKEYIQRTRKDSTEEETEHEEEGDFEEHILSETEMQDPQPGHGIRNSFPEPDPGLSRETKIEESATDHDAISSEPISSENLSLDYDQPDGCLTGEHPVSGREDDIVEKGYEDDFETDISEQRDRRDEIVEEIKPEVFEEEHFLEDRQNVKKEPDSAKILPEKDAVRDGSPFRSFLKEIPYNSQTHDPTIDFRIGENYTMSIPVKDRNGGRIPYGAASTTAATIGDEDDLAIKELDEDIAYERKDIADEDHRSDEGITVSQPSQPEESISRSTSLSDITDNTDELLEPSALEKAWSQGAGLDEDDELFQVLFRTPPRRRKHRNRSEINPHDVSKGKQEAMAFKTTFGEEPVSPRRRQNLEKRPFIPSWPFDPMSLLDSRDLGELDKEAMRAALDAQRELLEETNRLKDMVMIDDVDFSSLDAYDTQTEPASKPGPTRQNPIPRPNKEGVEFLGARSRSPSASPRMVGEEFIPGVPDFVHSVVPYQLPTPVDSIEPKHNFGGDDQVAVTKEPIASEHMKFPQSILKFAGPAEDKGKLTCRYSPPVGVGGLPIAHCESSAEELEVPTHSQPVHQDNLKSAWSQPTTSSGRSTPQSGAGNTSHSEGTTSSNSKSSSSSFPRFIHSVFPLRRSSSSDRRGRSKTRRKREKKITKQKNKKKPRSKSKDKKNTDKTVPVVEITAPTNVTGFTPFPILPSPPHYSILQQRHGSSKTAQEKISASDFGRTKEFNGNRLSGPKPQYDQESLDKIVLSESDNAHSDSATPETVRRADGFKGGDQTRIS